MKRVIIIRCVRHSLGTFASSVGTSPKKAIRGEVRHGGEPSGGTGSTVFRLCKIRVFGRKRAFIRGCLYATASRSERYFSRLNSVHINHARFSRTRRIKSVFSPPVESLFTRRDSRPFPRVLHDGLCAGARPACVLYIYVCVCTIIWEPINNNM